MTENITPTIFEDEVQNEFWGKIQPDTLAVINILESKELHTHSLQTSPRLFAKIAKALPDVATLPVSKENQDILVKLIPLLSSMPLKASIFSMNWLNEKTAGSPMGWGTLCYLEALNITSNDQNHESYDLAQVMVDRVTLIMRLKLSVELFSQWSQKNSN